MKNIKMKTFKTLLACSVILLSACKKEITTVAPEKPNCFCGNVELQYIKYAGPNGTPFEWTYISRNNCTNAPTNFTTQAEYTDKEYCLNYQW